MDREILQQHLEMAERRIFEAFALSRDSVN